MKDPNPRSTLRPATREMRLRRVPGSPVIMALLLLSTAALSLGMLPMAFHLDGRRSPPWRDWLPEGFPIIRDYPLNGTIEIVADTAREALTDD